MSKDPKRLENLTKLVAIGAGLFTLGEKILGPVIKNASHRQGEQKDLYCLKEKKNTAHVAISRADAQKLSSGIETKARFRSKPYVCTECENVKWI